MRSTNTRRSPWPGAQRRSSRKPGFSLESLRSLHGADARRVRAARSAQAGLLVVIAGCCAVSPAQAGWSVARALSACAVAAPPQIAFPSASPTIPTGPGAIVWLDRPAACQGRPDREADAPLSLSVAWLGPGDLASATDSEALGTASSPTVLAAGASLGRVAVAATVGEHRTAVLQGRAVGRLTAAATFSTRQARLAVAHAYLGDVAVASVQAGPSITVDVERYFRPSFERPFRIPIAAGPLTALTVTMDYRSDVLVAWQQDGSVYAHMLRASGRAEPTQRVGPSGPDPQLQALVSDNDHGMIAWSSTHARVGSPARTAVYLALSAARVRFHGQRLIASFADPSTAGLEPGSLALVRLASEDVMLAWTEVESGHYVVLAAPAVFAAVRPATRLTPLAGQAVLAAMAPGGADEAVALWRRTVPGGSAPGWSRAQLWAARTFIDPHGRVGFTTPEMVGPAGPVVDPAIAVDPADDRAVAAWLEPGAHGGIDYAVGPISPGYRYREFSLPVAATGAGVHRLRITLAAAAAAAVVAAGGALVRARWRRSARPPR